MDGITLGILRRMAKDISITKEVSQEIEDIVAFAGKLPQSKDGVYIRPHVDPIETGDCDVLPGYRSVCDQSVHSVPYDWSAGGSGVRHLCVVLCHEDSQRKGEGFRVSLRTRKMDMPVETR